MVATGYQSVRMVLGLTGATLLMTGCASTPPVSALSADPHMAQRQAAVVIHEARSETALLRTELAAARIAMARQEAELQQARSQVDELNRALSVKELEFASVRHERDRLLLARKIQEDAGMTQAKLQEVESALTVLATEVAQVKQELAQAPVSMHLGTVRVPDLPIIEEGRPAWVIVQTHESLWLLARRYGLTVEELKAANKLERDQIHVGQRLLIPPPSR